MFGSNHFGANLPVSSGNLLSPLLDGGGVIVLACLGLMPLPE